MTLLIGMDYFLQTISIGLAQCYQVTIKESELQRCQLVISEMGAKREVCD